MRCYIDSSAAVKLVMLESESAALRSWVEANDVDLVSSDLLETEMRRAAAREGVAQSDVTELLGHIGLDDVPRSTFRDAGLLPGSVLRSLDAIHLAAAIRAEADLVITYDERMAMSAEHLGLDVLSPA